MAGHTLYRASRPNPDFAGLRVSTHERGDGRLVEARLRIALTIGLVALLAVPASAQRTHGKRDQSEGKQQTTAEQRKKTREAEEAYKAALDKIPDQKPADPWKNVR